MSMYNMVHGFNISCLFFLPMLGRKIEEYPRFRDCFISDDKKYIDILTRVGGNNRNNGYGEEELYKDENFVETFDSKEDNTYGFYRFNVPEKWKQDFEYILNGQCSKVSDEYVDFVKQFYPILCESGIVDKAFQRSK